MNQHDELLSQQTEPPSSAFPPKMEAAVSRRGRNNFFRGLDRPVWTGVAAGALTGVLALVGLTWYATEAPAITPTMAPETETVSTPEPAAESPTPTPSTASSGPLVITSFADLPTAGITDDTPVPQVEVAHDDTVYQSVQAFADDLADGNVAAIVWKCWTRPEPEVWASYGTASQRQAVLSALSSRVVMSDNGSGAVWGTASTKVSFLWEELRSPFACPTIGDPGELRPAAAQNIIGRLVARQAGTPAHSSDTEENYPLLCGNDCPPWTLHGSTVSPVATQGLTATNYQQLAILANQPVTVDLIEDAAGTRYARVQTANHATSAAAYFIETPTAWLLGEVS